MQISSWFEVQGNWVLLPNKPRGIVHFLGGAFVATAPQVTYRLLLEEIAQIGYAVVATPFINSFDHQAIARDVFNRFDFGLTALQRRYNLPEDLPIYGLGHSMGCKLHTLIGCYYEVRRSANILISFNNFAASKSIPFLDVVDRFAKELSVNELIPLEFTPTPIETLEAIDRYYSVERNLILKFNDDNLDQSYTLNDAIGNLFGDRTQFQILRGNHLTPLGQDVRWQVGSEFNPLDAIGQWFKTEVYRDFNLFKREIVRYLDNPV
jgi:hypothetical protein